MRIIKNNRVGMKGAYGNAGANTRFRRHRLLSLPALEDLASGSSPAPARGAELGPTEGKTERTQKPIMFRLFMQWHRIHSVFQTEMNPRCQNHGLAAFKNCKNTDFLHTSPLAHT